MLENVLTLRTEKGERTFRRPLEGICYLPASGPLGSSDTGSSLWEADDDPHGRYLLVTKADAYGSARRALYKICDGPKLRKVSGVDRFTQTTRYRVRRGS